MFFLRIKVRNKLLHNILKRDFDSYDKISDHLIIIDNNIKGDTNVVGAYRLLNGNISKIHKGFYTEEEFEISNLKKSFSSRNILELSCSCIHSKYRSGLILKLLWEGIAVYIKNYNDKVLVGCASFHRKNPDIFKAEFSLLYQKFVIPENYSVRSLQNSTNILICNINYQKRHLNNYHH